MIMGHELWKDAWQAVVWICAFRLGQKLRRYLRKQKVQNDGA